MSALAVTGASLLGPGTSLASSHREAPYTAGDPAIDNTDVYAFTSPDKANTATIIADWYPFQEPSGGPNFYPWATDAAYDINIDNNGDAKPDVTYRWVFKNVDNRGTTDHGDKNDSADGKIKGNGIGGTFLNNDGAVTSLEDTHLLFRQTYTLTEIDTNASGTATTKTLLTDAPAAPSNVGSASMPDYASLRQEAVTKGSFAGGTANSYAGQADDPFFLDLRVFDLLYGGNLGEAGHDTLSHYNVNTIALQLPKTALAGKNDPTKNPVVGIWSTTSRSSTRTLALTGAGTSTAESTSPTTYDSQVSRLGNPLVNEVVVPAQLKDYFNRSTPSQDGALLGKVQNPELPDLLKLVYDIPNPDTIDAPGAATRNDLSEVFLTGISKKAAAGTDFSGIAKGGLAADLNSLDLNTDIAEGGVVPAEYLRLNLTTPVTAKPNRLGALGNDLQGYPNGRRLTDDVLDEALQVTEGALLGTKGYGLSDGVDTNDHAFLPSFPYIADPNSGSTVGAGQTPVTFRQGFTSAGGKVTLNVAGISPAQKGGKVELFQTSGNTFIPLGAFALNADGTALATPVVRTVGSGHVAQFYVRLLTGPNSNNSPGYGPLTTITSR